MILGPLRVGRMLEGGPMVEMSFSYNATSKEPRSHFQYGLIGTEGVIRYNREEHSMALLLQFLYSGSNRVFFWKKFCSGRITDSHDGGMF